MIVEQAKYNDGSREMYVHDTSPRMRRMKGYAGLDSLNKRDHDPNWNKTIRQAKSRYKLTPARLRSMGLMR